MVKKRCISIALIAMLTLVLLTACGGNETYHNIAAQNNPYSMGTQSVLIKASSVNADEPRAKFKQSISPSDIKLGQALEGKTVKSVTYNGETSITVVLDGNTKVAGGDDVYGTITVKQSGMASKGASTCTVNVCAPEIRISSYTVTRKKAGDVTIHNIIARLSLPVGAFTDKAVKCITLSDGVTGEMIAALSDDGTLSLTIKNCNTANPSICIDADATTLEKGISFKLTLGGSARFQ